MLDKNAKKILFVEDETDLVDVYHLLFDGNGYEFFSTKDIDDAMIICDQEKIDLVLLDILLPGKDGQMEKSGFVFLEKLKKDNKLKNIPVVIFTNLNSREDEKKGLALGAEDYLLKTERTPRQVLTEVEEIFNVK